MNHRRPIYTDPAVIADELRKRKIEPPPILRSDSLLIDLGAGQGNAYQFHKRFLAAWFYSKFIKVHGREWENIGRPPCTAIAHAIGSKKSHVSNFIKDGTGKITNDKLDRTAEICGVSESWFILGMPPVPPWLRDYDIASEHAQEILRLTEWHAADGYPHLSINSPPTLHVERILVMYDRPDLFKLSEIGYGGDSLNRAMYGLINFPMMYQKVVEHIRRRREESAGIRTLHLESHDMSVLHMAFGSMTKGWNRPLSSEQEGMIKRIENAFMRVFGPPEPKGITARKPGIQRYK